VLGGIAWLAFFAMLFLDARFLSRLDDLSGSLGLAWTAIATIIFASLFYKHIITVNGLMYPFWLFTGHVLAEAFRERVRSGTLPDPFQLRQFGEDGTRPVRVIT
jgi:hypothetical protein